MLNDKQRKFVSYYVKDPNASKAAKLAGYSERSAYNQGKRLLQHPEVIKEIEKQAGKIKNKNILDAKQRMELLSEIALGGDNSNNDRIKAIDTLNKMDATYITQVDITSNQEVNLTHNPFKELSSDELKELIDLDE